MSTTTNNIKNTTYTKNQYHANNTILIINATITNITITTKNSTNITISSTTNTFTISSNNNNKSYFSKMTSTINVEK